MSARPVHKESLPEGLETARLDFTRLDKEELEVELELRRHIEQFESRIRSHCRRFAHDSHDADDATQQTFIALARQLREMRRTGQSFQRPLAWLLRVAERSSIDTVRARQRRRNHERAAAGQRCESMPVATSHEVDARIAVQETLDTLPASYRTPMILFYFGGQNLEAIAKQLSMTENAVSVKLHRGRSMLAKRLRSRGVVIPAALLPLLLAQVIRDHVIANAGANLFFGGGASTLHASSAILCGAAMASSSTTSSTLPASSFIHLPFINGRIGAVILALVIAMSINAGGSGMLNHARALLPSIHLKLDLLRNLRQLLQSTPKLTAKSEAPPAAAQTQSLARTTEFPRDVAPTLLLRDGPQHLRTAQVFEAFALPSELAQTSANAGWIRNQTPAEALSNGDAPHFVLSTPFTRPAPTQADQSWVALATTGTSGRSDPSEESWSSTVLASTLPTESEVVSQIGLLPDFGGLENSDAYNSLDPFDPNRSNISPIQPEPGSLTMLVGLAALATQRTRPRIKGSNHP